MKLLILTIYLALGVGYIYSQTPATNSTITKIGEDQVYKFRTTLTSDLNFVKDVSGDSSVKVIKGHLIKRSYNKGDKVYITYLPFNTDSRYASTYNDKLFEIESEDRFRSITDSVITYKKYKGVSVGVYTVPFRLRSAKGGKFDYESSLSLSSNLIFGFGHKRSPRSQFDLSVGIGLTGANLDSLNSNVLQNRTAMAFTVNGGAIWKPSNYTNIGVFVGLDFLGNKDRSVNWIYNKRPWLGIGINISFNQFTGNSHPDPKGTQDKKAGKGG